MNAKVIWCALFLLANSAILPANAETHHTENSASKTQDRVINDVQLTLTPATQDAIKRISGALEKANVQKNTAKDDERAERDVRAQERMSDWAPWMFALGTVEIMLTAVGVWLLYNTLKETRRTARDTADELALARKTYIASNRPRLRVRKISIDAPVLGEPITVRYEVINVGATKAAIVDNEITIRVRLPQSTIMYATTPEVTSTKQFHFADELTQGEALTAAGEIIDFDPEWGFNGIGPWWANRLFVIGMIRYLDDNGVMRRTAFYRVATGDRNRFETPDWGANVLFDHEYED